MADTSNDSSRDGQGLAWAGLRVAGEAFQWRMPSKPELVEKVVMELKERAAACGVCGEEQSTGLVIALNEAITNAIVHGNLEISSELRERTDGAYGRMLAQRCTDPAYAGREVQIDVTYDGTRCEWTVTDEGQGFDIECVLRRLEEEVAPDELASGRGLMLMRALMDDVTWENDGRRVKLVMVRKGSAGAQRVRVCVPTHVDGVDAVATSVSPEEVHLLGTEVLPLTQVLLEVEVRGRKETFAAEVRQIHPLGGAWVQIDCRLPAAAGDVESEGEPSHRAAVERVIAACSRPMERSSEERGEERYTYTDRVVVERRGGEILQGIARNISRRGLGFIGNFGLEKGEVFTLKLEPDGRVPLKVHCVVVRCQALAGVYRDFGVKFL